MVLQKKEIPDNYLLFKLLKQNFLNNININNKLIDVVCINKNYNKNISLFENGVNINIKNYIIIKNLEFDYTKNTINILDNSNKKDNKLIKGGLYLCDICIETVNYLLENCDIENFNTLIVVRDDLYNKITSNHKIDKVLENEINIVSHKKKYKRIILCNCNIKTIKLYKSLFNNIILWVIDDRLSSISVDKFIMLFNCVYDYSIEHINYDIVVNLLKYICFRNQIHFLIKHGKLCIKNNLKLEKKNNYTNYLWKFDINKNDCLTKNKCCVCLEFFNNNNICRLDCDHYFCFDCVNMLIKTSNTKKMRCPLCKKKTNYIVKLEQYRTEIIKLSYKYNVGIALKQIIKKSETNNNAINIIIIDDENINFLIKSLLHFLDIKKKYYVFNNIKKLNTIDNTLYNTIDKLNNNINIYSNNLFNIEEIYLYFSSISKISILLLNF